MKKTKRMGGKAVSLSKKLLTMMVIITVLQLITFVAVFLFGGEFAYIRKYAYDSFIEKNSNRRSYIESTLNNKTEMVYDSADAITAAVEKIAVREGRDIRDIRTDKEFNREIMNEASSVIISLIRQNQVNDAFIILDTGTLYNNATSAKLGCLYIRDIDPTQNDIAKNEDLLMEVGSSDIASDLGIVLDYEWTAHADVTDNSDGSFDFYFETLEKAKHSRDKEDYEISRWYGFSGISRSAQKSMKFVVPLISSDGRVYGVTGIGITEKYILSELPDHGSFERDICYILGSDSDNDGIYEIQMHSGPMFSRLVNENTRLCTDHRIEGNIYDFNPDGDIDSVGNIQEIELYNSSSVYNNHKWALIAVGERVGIMSIYHELLKMFAVSSIISVIITIIGALLVNKNMTSPVAYMIGRLKESEKAESGIIDFASSNILEIDALGKEIVQLQINVRENASRVSRLISMVDMGIGVFMFDRQKNNVFMGESLIKLLNINELSHDEDVIVPFDSFAEFIRHIDSNGLICSDNIFTSDDENDNAKRDIEIEHNDKYLKFSLTRDKSDVIGLVQDITNIVLEKKRIEFERDYDVTTGLLNRRAYLSKLDELFADPARLKTAAVIMIDLDNLKYVNDTYGHDFGDEYIRAAADVFRGFSVYGGIVSRMSGDEFNIFFYGYDTKDEIRKLVSDLGNTLMKSSCMLADGTKYRIRASGGVAWYPDDSDNYEQLIKYADFSMYTIKHSTKGSIAEFDISVYRRDSILMTGIEEMNRIIEAEAVRFAFQPIVSISTGTIFGYELLMRPQSDIFKSPLDFIRIAGTGSKLYEIERLTWVKGLSEFNKKLVKGQISRESKLFINSLSNCIVSITDIDHIERTYPELLKNIVLEVLESEKENEIYTGAKQDLLKKWHAKLALDDFGSGYNSELLFIKLNPDIIKIDRSIISGCDIDSDKESILNGLIKMAHNKDILVLAEGVETSGELKQVIDCGVDLVQGFYVSHPMLDPTPLNEEICDEIRSIYTGHKFEK